MLTLASCLALVFLASAAEAAVRPQICPLCVPCPDWKPPPGFTGCPPCCTHPLTTPKACPRLLCAMFIKCVNGHVLDSNGCPTCRCRTAPKPCPRLPCAGLIKCAYGQVLDRNGCPTCRCRTAKTGCRVGRVTYAEGARIPSKNPCEFCTCRNGRKSCAIIGCAPPPCPNPIRPPGQCCSQCPDGPGPLPLF